jgi:hypothetical protein
MPWSGGESRGRNMRGCSRGRRQPPLPRARATAARVFRAVATELAAWPTLLLAAAAAAAAAAATAAGRATLSLTSLPACRRKTATGAPPRPASAQRRPPPAHWVQKNGTPQGQAVLSCWLLVYRCPRVAGSKLGVTQASVGQPRAGTWLGHTCATSWTARPRASSSSASVSGPRSAATWARRKVRRATGAQ